MSLKHLHLLRPLESRLPGFEAWLVEAMQVMQGCAHWETCKIQETVFDNEGGFNSQSVADKILQSLGPVVIIPNSKTGCRADLAKRIGNRTVIASEPIADPASLWQLIEKARVAYLAGDPQLPRNLVLAILLINKLEKELMWGGNSKGFKWLDDLISGRGIPPAYSGLMPNIINQLLGAQILRPPKTSQGYKKHALNPALRTEIYVVLKNRSFAAFPNLERIFMRDVNTMSCRDLDELRASD
jgi:hypothetical protein